MGERREVWTLLSEDDKWRCYEHPTHIVGGVCPHCLRLRLLRLCPDCAADLPCSCPRSVDHLPTVSHLIRNEPPFHRSRSLRPHPTARNIWSFLWPFTSSSATTTKEPQPHQPPPLPNLRRSTSVRAEGPTTTDVAPPRHSCSGVGSTHKAAASWGRWHFPSPIKAFAPARSRMERSPPICRG